MYSNVKLSKKDNALNEILFLVQFGGLKCINTSGKNSNSFDFNVFLHLRIYIYILAAFLR